MPAYYPVFLDLKGRLCVVIGGGAVAERKVAALLECGARVRVVAPRVTTPLRRWAQEGRVEHLARAYSAGDLQGALIAIAGTDDRSTNAEVYREAQGLGVLVNMVDDPDHCSFIAPALIRRGEVQIAVSTGGASPALARHLRQRLEKAVPPEYEPLAGLLGRVRRRLRREGKTPSPEAWQAAIDEDLLALVRQESWAAAEARLLEQLRAAAAS
ncbi:MAG: bifunctional precorrin-2 dehydrogenase/sirohydrochlorin ferrochelatase [Chloroflexi bacterium]|nr:bifunctional precorrin-2 dehydrogenase/sirohydrochlorin ferrochelatase [Chloroflexota bacterium]